MKWASMTASHVTKKECQEEDEVMSCSKERGQSIETHRVHVLFFWHCPCPPKLAPDPVKPH